MFRIDDASAAVALPTPEAAGTEGYWTEGNPATGVPATLERASWFNMLQEELRAIVVAGGLTPSKTVYNQVLSAINTLAQNSSALVGATSGTSDAIIGTFSPVPAAAVNGAPLLIRAASANGTTTPTFTPNNGVITPATIVKGPNIPLAIGDIAGAGHWLELQWDSTLTKYVLQNPATGITSAVPVPVRQSILAGAAAFITIGSGLQAGVLGTTTPLRMSFAAGIGSNGQIDYVGTISADNAAFWTGLTANVVNYLFVERNNSTGALTGVSSTLPYITQDSSATLSVANGQHTYVTDTGQMYVGNGTVATAVQRTAVGECLAGASTITTVTSYAKFGQYDSGFAQNLPATGTVGSKTHNIGAYPDVATVILECTTADLNYSVGDRLIGTLSGTNAGAFANPIPVWATRLACGFTTETSISLGAPNKTGSNYAALTQNSWKYKTIVRRGW